MAEPDLGRADGLYEPGIHASGGGAAGRIPFGVGIGLPLAVLDSAVSNILPIPFLILFTCRAFVWLRCHIPDLENVISRLERKAESKVQKFFVMPANWERSELGETVRYAADPTSGVFTRTFTFTAFQGANETTPQ